MDCVYDKLNTRTIKDGIDIKQIDDKSDDS